MKSSITNQEVARLSNASQYDFPKYTTQIINLMNQTAQGTRAKVVGQMSELIQEFDGQTLEEWVKWYNQRQPDSIENATNKIFSYLQSYKDAIQRIDKKMIQEWVEDLVYTKTFCGLKVQQAIISHIAHQLGKEWRLANPEEEAKGIDGYIGTVAVQIKADTYKTESHLNEEISVPIIYYKKNKTGLSIEYDERIFA